MVVQRRGQHGNPQDYFSRGMADYVRGFGDPSAEFWLGLDKMLLLTKNGAELRIDLETYEVTERADDKDESLECCREGRSTLGTPRSDWRGRTTRSRWRATRGTPGTLSGNSSLQALTPSS